MTIYRGVGGGGDATSDVELNALTSLSTAASDAATAAQGSATAAAASAGTATTQANNASSSASTAAASAALAQALAGTAPSQTGNAGKYLTTDGTATSWGVVTSNPGTVTSVAATVPSFLSVAGSPITSSGTLAISLSGTALPVVNGGTGATTATTAFNALAPSQASNSGKYLTTDGTNTSWGSVASPVVTDKIQPILATVASNALTITLNPTTLDFRSTTLGSGAVTTVTLASATSVVVPTLATLGTISAQQSRLVVLAINNAGTIEAAVVNIAGGKDLTETGLISTTAISGSATANNVVYSTTARTSVAYRVVGYVESTQATAGTWATAPSTVQGYGGQALAAMSSLGYGQTWQSVARGVGTTYYNTTGRPIYVSAWDTPGANLTGYGGAQIAVNGVLVAFMKVYMATENNALHVSAVIPPGASYVITFSGVYNVQTVAELR